MTPYHFLKSPAFLELRSAWRLRTPCFGHRTFVSKSGKGFTLVELILYVAIASILLSATTLFLGALVEVRVKNQTIAEVNGQGMAALDYLTQTIRNAAGIVSPATTTSASSAVLNTLSPALSPTTFDTASGVLRVTEGATTTVLTNARVAASNLTITNLSSALTPGTLRISFTLSYVNATGRNEYEYVRTFVGSATLRYP